MTPMTLTPRQRPTALPARPLRLGLAALAIAAVAACSSGPQPNAMLDQARTAYGTASTDPQIVRAAPAELQSAQQALQQAEAAQRDKQDPATVSHYAYLARQRVATAQQAAQQVAAEQSAATAASQRDQIVLSARTREAEAQRAQAEQARMQAEQAQRQAQQQMTAAEAARQQAAAESSRSAQLEQQLADLNAKQTQRGLVLTLGDVLFDTGKATLNPGAGRTVDQLAAFLKENPNRSVQIEGYTDSTGSDSLNQTLSEQRAASVKDALMQRGVDPSRVTARGFGKSNPVATNATEAGRQQNRRIEIVVSNATS